MSDQEQENEKNDLQPSSNTKDAVAPDSIPDSVPDSAPDSVPDSDKQSGESSSQDSDFAAGKEDAAALPGTPQESASGTAPQGPRKILDALEKTENGSSPIGAEQPQSVVSSSEPESASADDVLPEAEKKHDQAEACVSENQDQRPGPESDSPVFSNQQLTGPEEIISEAMLRLDRILRDIKSGGDMPEKTVPWEKDNPSIPERKEDD